MEGPSLERCFRLDLVAFRSIPRHQILNREAFFLIRILLAFLKHININLAFHLLRGQDADATVRCQCNQTLCLGSPFHIDCVQRLSERL